MAGVVDRGVKRGSCQSDLRRVRWLGWVIAAYSLAHCSASLLRDRGHRRKRFRAVTGETPGYESDALLLPTSNPERRPCAGQHYGRCGLLTLQRCDAMRSDDERAGGTMPSCCAELLACGDGGGHLQCMRPILAAGGECRRCVDDGGRTTSRAMVGNLLRGRTERQQTVSTRPT